MSLLCRAQEVVLYTVEELGSLSQIEMLMLLLKWDMVGNQWVLQ